MLTSLLVVSFILSILQQPAACADVDTCRQAALEAAGQKNYEAFHDLAWRAVQKGRRNDPELMWLLARAQSLSGRPGDALVMLRRIANTGIAAAASNDEDFQRVRALPGWPDVEAAIVAAAAKNPPNPETAARTPDTGARPNASPKVTGSERAARPERAKTAAPVNPASPAPRTSAGEDALRLPATTFEPVGLAYDTVSRRFVVGDRSVNKLIVADDVFKRVNDFVGAGSGGFGALTALEIDRRRGDLWVASSGGNGAASVHKLQLVSGRVLARVDVPAEWLPARLSDIAVADSGELLFVDSEGARVLTLAASGREFARPVPLGVTSPSTIAFGGGQVYVAHQEGLATVDLNSRKVVEVRASRGVPLTGLRRIRWHRGTIVAVQDVENAGSRLVRIRLGRSGAVASRRDLLDDQSAEPGSVLTISDNTAFYVARSDEGPTIRRVPLR